MTKKRHPTPQHHRWDIIEALLSDPGSNRAIAARLGVSKTTVGRHRAILDTSGITTVAQARAMSADALDALFNKRAHARSLKHQPDWAHMHEELESPGVTLRLLWKEYQTGLLQQGQPANRLLSYSQFAFHYAAQRARRPVIDRPQVVMRQHHEPGASAQVDYSGKRPHYIDANGRTVTAELFVGVLPCSGLIFATCTATQQVPDFIAAHVRMLAYFGGAPLALIPDNLRSAVVTPGKNPVLQRAYADFANYYNIAVVPARVRRPRDKAAVETSVCIVQREILAPLRHETFRSVDELNQAVAEKLEILNARPMRKDGTSRRDRFERMERDALRPLPAAPYTCSAFLPLPAVPPDYHVTVFQHAYSVPHTLVGRRLEARVSGDGRRIDILDGRTVVAAHVRSAVAGGATTCPDHQPPHHRHQAGQTPKALHAWAAAQGGAIDRFVAHQFAHASQPFHALPACQRLRALCDTYTGALVQEACQSAFDLNVPTISTVLRFVNQRAASPRKSPAPGRGTKRSTTRGLRRRSDPTRDRRRRGTGS